MKNNDLYKYYLIYLDDMLNKGKINNGSYQLRKISEDLFNAYMDKYNINEKFKQKQDILFISEIRDEKLINIL